MNNKKGTKRALLSSVLALVLCFSMLVGTTFAWFTDTATAGVNTIQSGTLDIVLEYSEDNGTTWADAEGQSLNFKTADGRTTNIYWEPGCTYELPLIRVRNNGNLALKYEIVISGLTGDVKLLEAIDFYVNDEVLLDSYTGTLLENEAVSDTMLIKGHMKEAAGNEYQDLKIENISISVFATQMTYENDSYGPDYDDGAYILPTVYDAAELMSALEQGESVKLGTDITATETIDIPAGADVELDLDGYTLNGNVYVNTGAALAVSDGNLVNADSSKSGIESVGNLVLNNVSISSARHGVRIESGTAEINGGTYQVGTFTGNGTYHAVNVSGGATVTINNGTFIGPKGTVADSGSAVCVQDTSVVTINGGNFSGGKNNTLAPKATATLKVTGGTFDQDPSQYVANYYTAVDNGDGTWTVTVTNDDLKDMLADAQSGDIVNLPAGTYTFPTSSFKEGVTLVCADGVVFDGQTSLNINGATVEGATFTHSTDYLTYHSTINGTFKNCTFTDSYGLRYCYAGETVVFENCVFDGKQYGIHFDSGANDVVFKHCTLSGFNTFGGGLTMLTFEDCTFKANGKSGYNGINMFGSTEMINCRFEFEGIAGTEWVHARGTNKTYTFTNCVVFDGTTEKGIETVVGGNVTGNTIIIDGYIQKTAATQAELTTALTSGGNVDVTLSAGEYKMPSSTTTGNVTITGTKDTILDVTKGAYLDKANVTITGVTIKTSTGYVTDENGNKGSDYAALYSPNTTYVNCTFVGPMRVGRDGAKFIDCTFTEMGNDYIWTYGNDVTFENCTFNTAGKAILIYSDGGNEVSQVVVKNCTFNATTGAKAGAIANQNCAAIEIHNYGNGVNLTTSGNTYDSNFSGEWRIKTYETGKPSITVNGSEYTTIAIDGKTMTIDANKNVTVNG